MVISPPMFETSMNSAVLASLTLLGLRLSLKSNNSFAGTRSRRAICSMVLKTDDRKGGSR